MQEHTSPDVQDIDTLSETIKHKNEDIVENNAPAFFSTYMHIDTEGGNLIVPQTGVCLTIPHGAIPVGHTLPVMIGVVGPGYSIEKDYQPVSMSIVCEPSGYQFKKTVILSYPHCVQNFTTCTFQHLISSSSKTDHLMAAEDDPGVKVIVDETRVTWFVNHFTWFTSKVKRGKMHAYIMPYVGPFNENGLQISKKIEVQTQIYHNLPGQAMVSKLLIDCLIEST